MEPFLFLGFIFICFVLLPWWTISRARTFLDHWAETNGYQVVSASVRLLRRGPYFLKSSNNQVVFRITVSAALDDVRTGWVRCGSYWLGVLAHEVDVTWDSEQQTAS